MLKEGRKGIYYKKHQEKPKVGLRRKDCGGEKESWHVPKRCSPLVAWDNRVTGMPCWFRVNLPKKGPAPIQPMAYKQWGAPEASLGGARAGEQRSSEGCSWRRRKGT